MAFGPQVVLLILKGQECRKWAFLFWIAFQKNLILNFEHYDLAIHMVDGSKNW